MRLPDKPAFTIREVAAIVDRHVATVWRWTMKPVRERLLRSFLIGGRRYIRRVAQIHIPLDTPCEKVEKAVAIIRDALCDHEGMDPDRPPRVFFNEFTANAFSIEFVYWYTCSDRWKFKAFSEKLNFEIFRKFEAQGIQFSLPFRHSFWKRDDVQGPLDVKLLTDGARHKPES